MRGVNETPTKASAFAPPSDSRRPPSDVNYPPPPVRSLFPTSSSLSLFRVHIYRDISFSIPACYFFLLVFLRVAMPGSAHSRGANIVDSRVRTRVELYFLKRPRRSVFLYHLPERLRVRMREHFFAPGEIQICYSFLDL